MMQRKRWLSLAMVALFIAGSALAGCAPKATPTPVPPPTKAPEPTPPPPAGPKRGGTLIIGAWQEPQTFLAGLTGVNVALEVAYLVHGFLVKVDDNLEFASDFLTEIPTVTNGGISEDGLTYEFQLKKGVKWHDGQDFTSADVKFTLESQQNPDMTWYSTSGWDRVESVETPDDQTVVMKLSKPYPAFLEVWVYSPLLPEHILGDVPGEEWATHAMNREPVGLGPFVFKEWESGDHITFERNPSFANPDLPYLDKIIYKIVPDKNVLLAQLEKGEVDTFFYIGSAQIEQAEALDNIDIYETQAISSFTIWINNGDPEQPWYDKKVRQALAYGFDKEGIVQAVVGEAFQPAYGPVPPISWAYKPDVTHYERDPEKAKQLLQEAGWTDSDGDGVRDKDGKKFSLTLMNIPGEPERVQILQFIQNQWKEIGVEMEIAGVKFPEMSAGMREGTFEMAYSFNTMKVDPGLRFRYGCGMGANYMHFCDERADEIITSAESLVDPEARKELYWEFQDIYAEELPAFSMYWRVLFDGVNKRVQGPASTPVRGGPYWNIGEWWVE